METANMMRVNARSGSFAGQGNAQQDRQQQHRQKVYALFDAIDSENLEASKQAFQALINFEPRTSANPQFDRLSKLLNAGSIYLAQQLIKDIKSSADRTDLTPIFSFNSDSIYYGLEDIVSPAHLSRWQDVIRRARQQGLRY